MKWHVAVANSWALLKMFPRFCRLVWLVTSLYVSCLFAGVRKRRCNGEGRWDFVAAQRYASNRMALAFCVLLPHETIEKIHSSVKRNNLFSHAYWDGMTEVIEAEKALMVAYSSWDRFSPAPAGFKPRLYALFNSIVVFLRNVPPAALADLEGNAPTRPNVLAGSKEVTPPLLAGYLLLFFLPNKDREAVTGDLQEQFAIVLKEDHETAARVWYWMQVIRSIGPFAWRRVEMTYRWLSWLHDLWRRL